MAKSYIKVSYSSLIIFQVLNYVCCQWCWCAIFVVHTIFVVHSETFQWIKTYIWSVSHTKLSYDFKRLGHKYISCMDHFYNTLLELGIIITMHFCCMERWGLDIHLLQSANAYAWSKTSTWAELHNQILLGQLLQQKISLLTRFLSLSLCFIGNYYSGENITGTGTSAYQSKKNESI